MERSLVSVLNHPFAWKRRGKKPRRQCPGQGRAAPDTSCGSWGGGGMGGRLPPSTTSPPPLRRPLLCEGKADEGPSPGVLCLGKPGHPLDSKSGHAG